MEKSFHGRTMAALSATGQEKIKHGFDPILGGFDFVPFNDIDALKKKMGPATCAVMLEPVQGEGGVRCPSPDYLKAVRQVCDETGVLLYQEERFSEAEKLFSLFADKVIQNKKVKEKQEAIKYIVYCNNALRYENMNVFNSQKELTAYQNNGQIFLPVFYNSPNIFLKEVSSYSPVCLNDNNHLFYMINQDQPNKKADTNINVENTIKIRRDKVKLTDLCFNQDSTVVIFSSNKKGGYGGYDLYMAEKKANGKWSKPVNMGHAVNTSHDECFPSLAADNVTLFFSSNNLKSMGGFDVFYSTRDENGQWSVYENLGSAINTLSDEIKFLILPSSNLAYYYSSYNRKGQTDGVYRVVFK